MEALTEARMNNAAHVSLEVQFPCRPVCFSRTGDYFFQLFFVKLFFFWGGGGIAMRWDACLLCPPGLLVRSIVSVLARTADMIGLLL